jgi:V-type H+-transporting ATPase subunit a
MCTNSSIQSKNNDEKNLEKVLKTKLIRRSYCRHPLTQNIVNRFASQRYIDFKNMGSWWRSEDMTYVSLILSEEAAPAAVRELGILGCFQFTDLNPELTPFQRRYVSYIKRCDEIERKIRYVSQESKKMGITLDSAGSVDSFIHNTNGQDYASGTYVLESIESTLDVCEQQLLDLNKFYDKLAAEFQNKVKTFLT